MSHHLVEVRDLHHRFPDGTLALDGLSFRLHHGERVALIGANGAGKSTLLLHLNGCLLPHSGEVRIGEVPVTPATLRDIRRTVGLLFQNPDDQLFTPTVLEDVRFGPLNLGLPIAEAETRAQAALESVEALHLAHKAPYHLSAGEKRRCALAAVLAMGPDVLVLDEPTTGLDPRGRGRLRRILEGFHHTMLVASHDLAFVRSLCPRTLVLHHGRLAADGPTEAILADTALLASVGLSED